jgi:hypothetical protein
MAQGRMEIEQEPGTFVSGARARWLIQARRAQAAGPGKLRLLLEPPGTATRDERERTRWSSYSSAGVRNYSGKAWLHGFHMNGAAMNRASR